MIPVRHEIERDHRLTVAEFRSISKLAWEEAGEAWHAQVLPKHFELGAVREYGYAKRDRGYQIRKARLKGHQLPLVYTGDLRRQVLRIRDVRVTGSNSKRQGAARIVLRGPRYLHAYRKDLRQPDKAAELRSVSERDAQLLAGVLDRRLERELNRRTGRDDITSGHRGRA